MNAVKCCLNRIVFCPHCLGFLNITQRLMSEEIMGVKAVKGGRFSSGQNGGKLVGKAGMSRSVGKPELRIFCTFSHLKEVSTISMPILFISRGGGS